MYPCKYAHDGQKSENQLIRVIEAKKEREKFHGNIETAEQKNLISHDSV